MSSRSLLRSIRFIGTLALLSVPFPPAEIHAGDFGTNLVVKGQVLDASRQAAVGIEVVANLPDHAPTRTDHQGAFQFAIPADKVHYLTITARSDDNRWFGYSRARSGDSDQHENLTLHLERAREIAVKVFDGQGNPVHDAHVVAIGDWTEAVSASKSNTQGNATLRLPRAVVLSNIFALKRGVGVDYVTYFQPHQSNTDPYLLPQDSDTPLTFVLNGTRSITVRVIDDAGEPLPQVPVHPWYYEKPNKAGDLNLSGCDVAAIVTGEDGTAVIDTIPIDNQSNVQFWATATGYAQPNACYRPAGNFDSIDLHLQKLVPLRGRVLQANGANAAGIPIQVEGAGYGDYGSDAKAITDGDGNFTVQIAPNQFYMLVAGNKAFASAVETVVVREGEAPRSIELTLQPAIRVYGRVTVGSEKVPQKDQYVSLYLMPNPEYNELPESELLPNPSRSNRALAPRIVRSAETDADGRFEFFVGPGDYYIFGTQSQPARSFSLAAGDTFHEIDFHTARPDTTETRGRVVRADSPNVGIPYALVKGEPLASGLRRFHVVTDRSGSFASIRGNGEMIVYAKTKDGSLANLIHIEADESELQIPLVPVTFARGRLLDHSGTPVRNATLEYGIRIAYSDNTFSSMFGSEVTTDHDGGFLLPSLIPNRKYELHLKKAVEENELWTPVGTVEVTDSASTDLGTLKIPPPRSPYVPPSLIERIEREFQSNRAPVERIEVQQRDARLNDQRVLMVFADAKSEVCKRFFHLYFEHRSDILDPLFANFRLVALDPSDSKAKDLARELGVALPPLQMGERITLAILDESGKLSGQRAWEFGANPKENVPQLAAFLNDYSLVLPDAKLALAEALRKAKATHKKVLVEVSGAYCGYCVLLARYLDATQDLWGKDYVWVKLDARYKHGEEVIESLRGLESSGIPWMAILDLEGKPLITSDSPKGNIGYPGESDGIEHFRKMLRETRQRLTEEDIEALLTKLRKER